MNTGEWLGKSGKAGFLPGTFYTLAGPADYYVERLELARTLLKKVLAAQFAINADPGCIEAHLFMGIHLRDEATAMLHLEQAVAVGEVLWAPAIAAEGEGMEWWGCVEARPYMRALHALGLAKLEAGSDSEAVACFGRLLRMNPNDNQGARYLGSEPEPDLAPRM